MEKKPVIKITNIEKKFPGKTIFNDINQHFVGLRYCIVGKNGIGKTSLLNILAGLDTDFNGKYLVGDIDVKKDPKKANFFKSFTEANPDFYPSLTLEELSTYILGLRKIRNNRNYLDNLKYFGISDLQKCKIKTLSLGQRKKFFLSLNLLDEISIWIMDEPFISLDKKSVTLLLNKLNSRKNGTIILSTNNDEIIKKIDGNEFNLGKFVPREH